MNGWPFNGKTYLLLIAVDFKLIITHVAVFSFITIFSSHVSQYTVHNKLIFLINVTYCLSLPDCDIILNENKGSTII